MQFLLFLFDTLVKYANTVLQLQLAKSGLSHFISVNKSSKLEGQHQQNKSYLLSNHYISKQPDIT